MNKFTAAALRFLDENWDNAIEDTSGADLIRANRATLRGRIRSGRALCMRETQGRERASVEYTPAHLVFNMLYDALARFDAVPGDGAKEQTENLFSHVLDVRTSILRNEQNTDAVIRVTKRNGVAQITRFENMGEVEELTGEPVLIVPIGTMIVRFAASLMAKHAPEMMHEAVRI